ncbi:hypothetical protein OROHE_026107 [Orobanche hederae]
MASSPPPPAPGLTEKLHFPLPEQSSRILQIPSKSHSNSICKTLTVLVLLLAIPSFPSQAPDFISQTIFTQFWEIIHLLFIGIAVSYGLFGRKTEKNEISRNDDSSAYLSGISHLSHIFEDGFGNICCGPDEQDVMQSDYANCICKCFGDQFLGKIKCVVHGGNTSGSSTKIRSFTSNNARENFSDGNGENMNQAWSSKYLKSEALVVVSNGEQFLDESLDFKPLNLPVRSLRSNVVDTDKPELHKRNDSSPEIEAKSKNDVRKNRRLVPTNLEKKFEESDVLSSIPWRSKSGRMENEEESNSMKPCAHCRPHSVWGDFEFEHIKSSSHESDISRVETLEGGEVIPVPKPEIAPLSDDSSFIGSRARLFSIGDSSFEEDKAGKGKQPIESSDSDTKSLALAKALPRAKSVRTKRTSRYVMNQKEQHASRKDDELERMCHDFEGNSFVKRGKQEEREKPLLSRPDEETDRSFSMPKPKSSLPDFFNKEKEDVIERNVMESREERGEDRASEFNQSCDEDDAKTNFSYDLGSEVDRKAGEFIAKFREQIRLQSALKLEG